MPSGLYDGLAWRKSRLETAENGRIGRFERHHRAIAENSVMCHNPGDGVVVNVSSHAVAFPPLGGLVPPFFLEPE